MTVKGNRDGICHTIYQYAEDNNNIRKIMIKIKNRHILNIGMQVIFVIKKYGKSFQ